MVWHTGGHVNGMGWRSDAEDEASDVGKRVLFGLSFRPQCANNQSDLPDPKNRAASIRKQYVSQHFNHT